MIAPTLASEITTYLDQVSARHSHLCPRQVLGVRIGLAGLGVLGFVGPQTDKRLIVIAETDGCFVDGLEVTTGVFVGRRTLRIQDIGKVAAVFADTVTNETVRIAPRLDIRQQAALYAPEESRHYFAQLQAYQLMPVDELLAIRPVHLKPDLATLVGRPGVRVTCAGCEEEIINGREIKFGDLALCQTCAGGGYYTDDRPF